MHKTQDQLFFALYLVQFLLEQSQFFQLTLHGGISHFKQMILLLWQSFRVLHLDHIAFNQSLILIKMVTLRGHT